MQPSLKVSSVYTASEATRRAASRMEHENVHTFSTRRYLSCRRSRRVVCEVACTLAGQSQSRAIRALCSGRLSPWPPMAAMRPLIRGTVRVSKRSAQYLYLIRALAPCLSRANCRAWSISRRLRFVALLSLRMMLKTEQLYRQAYIFSVNDNATSRKVALSLHHCDLAPQVVRRVPGQTRFCVL